MNATKTLGTTVLLFMLNGVVIAAPATDTQSIMHQVFDAIAYLLPLSVRDSEYKSEWDKELINEKLKVLTDASNARVENQEFRFLARSFHDTVKDIDNSFRDEWRARSPRITRNYGDDRRRMDAFRRLRRPACGVGRNRTTLAQHPVAAALPATGPAQS